MKGLDLSRRYFEEYGLPLLRKKYPHYLNSMAAGLVGDGSECFGYDDEISHDHDFGPKFCIWLNDRDYEAIAEELDRNYRNLSEEFLGFHTADCNSYDGYHRHGVKKISDFYLNYTGCPSGPQTWQDWLCVPDSLLATCTNGEVFLDNSGEFTAIRNHILNGMPEDIYKKKLASAAFTMAQSGQYNYDRCMRHNEPGAAHLAVAEFVNNAIRMIYLLNKRHCPYYKWMFRGLQSAPILNELYNPLLSLIANRYQAEADCFAVIEHVSSSIIKELRRQGFSRLDSDYLADYAFDIQDSISNPEIRALPVTVTQG